jgi:hypothetical protein
MAEHEGLQVIARLGIVPAWARPKPSVQPTTLNSLRPESYAAYAQFVAAFAARYQDRVLAIVPWNEPNLTFEWGGRQVTPAEYVELLRQIYVATKAAAPEVRILGGALAPTLETSPNAINDLDYLRGMYEAGGGAYFDAVGVHTYGFTLPTRDDPQADRLNFRRFELLRAIMQQHGDAAKPVYITETGWNDHPRWRNAVTPGRRVTYTLDALQLAEQSWPTVQRMCWWYFRYPVPQRGYPDYFAFVTSEFRVKPIYTAVQAYSQSP